MNRILAAMAVLVLSGAPALAADAGLGATVPAAAATNTTKPATPATNTTAKTPPTKPATIHTTHTTAPRTTPPRTVPVHTAPVRTVPVRSHPAPAPTPVVARPRLPVCPPGTTDTTNCRPAPGQNPFIVFDIQCPNSVDDYPEPNIRKCSAAVKAMPLHEPLSAAAVACLQSGMAVNFRSQMSSQCMIVKWSQCGHDPQPCTTLKQ